MALGACVDVGAPVVLGARTVVAKHTCVSDDDADAKLRPIARTVLTSATRKLHTAHVPEHTSVVVVNEISGFCR